MRWIIVVLVLAGCSGTNAAPPQKTSTGYSWQTISDDTFVLDPGGVRSGYEVAFDTNYTPLIIVQAKFPVSVAYVVIRSQEDREKVARDDVEQLEKFGMAHCVSRHVLVASVQCPLSQETYVFVLKDDRKPAHRGKGVLAGNEVHVVYRGWKCWLNIGCK